MTKKILVLLWLSSLVLPVYANDGDTKLILSEIRQLRADMNALRADMNVLRADMNKRFEQVDRRFVQVEERFDFLQNLIYFLMGLVFASPFVAIYLKGRSDSRIQAVIFALKEIAQEDPKVSKALKIAGLQ